MTTCRIDRPTPYSQDRHALVPCRPCRPSAATTAPRRADTPPSAPLPAVWPSLPSALSPSSLPSVLPPALPSELSPSPSRLVRVARRLTVAVVGMLAVLAGVAMLVLPGPGLVTIALGFGILGREYTWAARVSASVRARIVTTTDSVREAVRRP